MHVVAAVEAVSRRSTGVIPARAGWSGVAIWPFGRADGVAVHHVVVPALPDQQPAEQQQEGVAPSTARQGSVESRSKKDRR